MGDRRCREEAAAPCCFIDADECRMQSCDNEKRASINLLALYDLTGNRTRVYAVRGRRLDRLTIRPYLFAVLITDSSFIIP